MKIKCGVDIIEISRIKHVIEYFGERFKRKIFSDKEIEYCESKGKQKYQHYAARFAVKEAIYKAISEEIKEKIVISWRDIETVNEKFGKPRVKTQLLDNNIVKSIDLSISHCKEYAIANVVVLYE